MINIKVGYVIIFRVAILFFLMVFGAGCQKMVTNPLNLSPIKVISTRLANNLASLGTDKYGNIYLIENQDKILASEDSFFVIKMDPELHVLYRKGLYFKDFTFSGLMDFGDDKILVLNPVNPSANYSSIVKIDNIFNVKWIKTIPFVVRSAGKSPDDKCFFTGKTGNDGVCVTDSGGNILWARKYSNSKSVQDNPNTSGEFASDKGLIFEGYDFGDKQGYGQLKIMKTDPGGNVVWKDSISPFDLPSYRAITSLTVAETKDGHVIAGFGTYMSGGSLNNMVAIYDKDGKNRKIIDLNTPCFFNGIGAITVFYSNYVDAIDDFYIGSMVKGTGTEVHYNISLSKFDSHFNKIFTKTYGGNNDLLTGVVIPAPDGGNLIGITTAAFGKGKNGNDIAIMKTDADGNLKR